MNKSSHKMKKVPLLLQILGFHSWGSHIYYRVKETFSFTKFWGNSCTTFFTSTYCFEIDFENSGENYYSLGKLFRCSRNKKWSNLWVLSWAILGHHLHHKNSTTNCLLFFQFDRSVCSNCLNGCSWLHFTTWLRREIVIR